MLTVTSAQLQAWLAAFFWPFARVLALLAATPAYGENVLPRRVRIGLAIAVALVLAPTLPAPPDVSPLSLAGAAVLARELASGYALGYTIRMVFYAVEAAGELSGLQMGLGYATLFDAQSNEVPVLGQLLGLVATLFFLALDGHLHTLRVLADTFQTLPVSARMLAPDGLYALAHWGTEIFRAGLLIALPLIAAMLVANLALGILARAAPQLNLFAVGFPLTLASGLVMLALTLPLLGPQLERMIAGGYREMTAVSAKLAR
jgi:flagellar biosynthetic protein FliR